jgi:hypothetical protein
MMSWMSSGNSFLGFFAFTLFFSGIFFLSATGHF